MPTSDIKHTIPATLLQEEGIAMTQDSLVTPSHKFAFSDIKRVSISRSAGILSFFKKTTHRLLVNDFKGEHIAFETHDKALMSRITAALARAQSSHTDNRELRRNA